MPFDGRAFIRDFMCRQVRVTEVFRRVSDERSKRWWKPFPVTPPMVGWVVGVTQLQTGHRTPGDSAYHDPWTGEWEGGDPPGFEETGPRMLAYLVTPWPTVTPHRVPPEAVEVLSEPVKPYFWGEEDRKLMARDGPRLPRDEKGRFVSGPLLPKED